MAQQTKLAAFGHHFFNPSLCDQALTHRSVGGLNNERLEFLGDALLGMIIAEELYRRFDRASEGELSRRRAELVRRATLAALARAVDLGAKLHLGEGELKSGGFRRDSILADAFEALIGAVYLDAGMEACRAFVLRHYRELLAHPPAAAVLKDAKTQLQEWLQARQRPLPVYSVLETRGEAHRMRFVVRCQLDQFETVAEGDSRRQAEQQAAGLALEKVK